MQQKMSLAFLPPLHPSVHPLLVEVISHRVTRKLKARGALGDSVLSLSWFPLCAQTWRVGVSLTWGDTPTWKGGGAQTWRGGRGAQTWRRGQALQPTHRMARSYTYTRLHTTENWEILTSPQCISIEWVGKWGNPPQETPQAQREHANRENMQTPPTQREGSPKGAKEDT